VKPKILYTAFDVVPSPKGASTHITYFVRGLIEAGYDLTLITAGDSNLPERETYFGATILRAPAGDEPNFLKRALAFGDYVLAHVAEANPYPVAHVRSIWSGFPLAEARERFGYRLLYEVNGLPSIEMKYHYPALRGTAVLDKIREQEIATLHLADAIICPSNVTAAYMTSLGIPPHKITIIPNGIDPHLFRPDLGPNALTSTKNCRYGLPQDPLTQDDAWVSVRPNPANSCALSNKMDIGILPFGSGSSGSGEQERSPALDAGRRAADLPTILYIGTLADWQGLETLIAAMPLVLARCPARLRLVGRGRKRQRKILQKRVRKLGLDGYVTVEPAVPHEQVPAIIAQADVCVTPLAYNDRNVTQGCCPLKLLEYMACGRPVVAANLPVVRELACAGTEALLFSPDDPADMAQNILAVLDDPTLAAHLGANAAARVHREFTWQVAQARLLQVYQSLLSRSTVDDKFQDCSPIREPGQSYE
jgi:glycosyltransferase involved in cell wall biosynthesis